MHYLCWFFLVINVQKFIIAGKTNNIGVYFQVKLVK